MGRAYSDERKLLEEMIGKVKARSRWGCFKNNVQGIENKAREMM